MGPYSTVTALQRSKISGQRGECKAVLPNFRDPRGSIQTTQRWNFPRPSSLESSSCQRGKTSSPPPAYRRQPKCTRQERSRRESSPQTGAEDCWNQQVREEERVTNYFFLPLPPPPPFPFLPFLPFPSSLPPPPFSRSNTTQGEGRRGLCLLSVGLQASYHFPLHNSSCPHDHRPKASSSL